MDFKKLDLGRVIIKKQLPFIKKELREEGERELSNRIPGMLKNISVIVTFGVGFFKTAGTEYTLIYSKITDTFHWMEMSYWQDALYIRNIEENDPVFPLLSQIDKDNYQFSFIQSYFDTSYLNTEPGTLESIGWSNVNHDHFKDHVWWHIAKYLKETRESLSKVVTSRRKIEEQKAMREFYKEHKNSKITLHYSAPDTLYVKINGKSYPIKWK